MRTAVYILLAAAIALAIGAGAFHAGRSYPHHHRGDTLHYRVHHQLKLTSQQEQQLATFEAAFDAERRRIETQLADANRRLGSYLREDQAMSPRVTQTVAEIHGLMGDLQMLTLRHILEMKQVMTPEQMNDYYDFVADAFAHNP